jgi:hypothetical protein
LQTAYLCHYAHGADLESVTYASGEVREWMVQPKLQLVRQYRGKPSEFVLVATAYAKAAAERMGLWKGVDGGRRTVPVLETLEEAKKRERFFPRPQQPTTAAGVVAPCTTATKRLKPAAAPWKPKHG